MRERHYKITYLACLELDLRRRKKHGRYGTGHRIVLPADSRTVFGRELLA